MIFYNLFYHIKSIYVNNSHQSYGDETHGEGDDIEDDHKEVDRVIPVRREVHETIVIKFFHIIPYSP